MSAQQPISNKGDIVMNPRTQRPIKVGSRIWLKLVKDGIISGEYSDENVMGEYSQEESKQQLQKRIKDLNKKQNMGTHVVKGRGIYKNKLVKRNKQLSTQDISKKTSKIASKMINDNSDEELERQLETMIYNELMQKTPKKIKASTRRVVQPKAKQNYKKKQMPLSEEETSGDELVEEGDGLVEEGDYGPQVEECSGDEEQSDTE